MDAAQWAIGAAVSVFGLLGSLLGCVWWLATTATRLSTTQERLEKELLGKLATLDQIPVIATKLGVLEAVVTRHQSDIKELRERTAHTRGRLDSLTEDE